MRAWGAVVVVLLGAVIGALVAGSLDDREPRSLAQAFAAAGMSLTAPPGWRGRATAFDPRERAPLVEVRSGDGIRISVVELGNVPGGPQVPPLELPIAYARADVRGGHRAVKTFSTRGRSFMIDAVFPAGALDEVNGVLSTFRVERKPGSDRRTLVRLRRRLHLPRASLSRCPLSRPSRPARAVAVAIGPGPVFPVLGGGARASLRDDPVRQGWYLHKTLWAIAPTYRGPVLIRGQRVDEAGEVRFGIARRPYLRWPGTWPETRGWRYVPSTIAVRGVGCYGLQIDGTTFSRVVVFEARL